MNAGFLSFISLFPGLHSTVNLIMLRLIFLLFCFWFKYQERSKIRNALQAVIFRMSPAAPDNWHRAVQPKTKERDTVSAGEKPSCHPHWQQWSGQVVTGKSSPGQKDDWGICEWPEEHRLAGKLCGVSVLLNLFKTVKVKSLIIKKAVAW